MSVVMIRPPAPRRSATLNLDYALHGRPALFSGGRVRAALSANGADAALVNGWIGGLLTGLNMALPQTYDVSPFPERMFVRDLVLAGSMSDPNQPLHQAAQQVVEALIPARAQSCSETMTLTDGDSQVMIRRDTLKFVQQALIRRGFLTPPRVDGCDSPALRAALRAFQSAVGLTAAGLPDPDTLLVLLRR